MTIKACLHILGLDSIEDHDQIHRAYRQQVKCWHPDQFTHRPEIHARAEERLKRINHAYAALKDYLKNHPPAQKVHDAAYQGTEAEPAKPPESQKGPNPFNWRQWFKPTDRTNEHAKEHSAQIKASKHHKNAASIPKKPSFGRIFREAADNATHCSKRSNAPRRYGTQRLRHPHGYKPRNKSMRIEGHVSAAPITAVKPISRISKIEGSG